MTNGFVSQYSYPCRFVTHIYPKLPFKQQADGAVPKSQ